MRCATCSNLASKCSACGCNTSSTRQGLPFQNTTDLSFVARDAATRLRSLNRIPSVRCAASVPGHPSQQHENSHKQATDKSDERRVGRSRTIASLRLQRSEASLRRQHVTDLQFVPAHSMRASPRPAELSVTVPKHVRRPVRDPGHRTGVEPLRESCRLQALRGWSHDGEIEEGTRRRFGSVRCVRK